MNRYGKSLLLATAVIVAGGIHIAPAQAVTLLTLESPGSAVYQQTQNSPCVIGDPSCNQPAGFPSTTIPANTDPITNLGSPVYTVGQITSLVGNTFFVGIDVNQAGPSGIFLDSFRLDIAGVTQFSYTGGAQLQVLNNGNGFSDALLKGFNLSGFAAGSTAQFFVTYHNQTDGREEFFLIASNAPRVVPEPASLILLGSGLAGIGLWGVKRRKSS